MDRPSTFPLETAWVRTATLTRTGAVAAVRPWRAVPAPRVGGVCFAALPLTAADHIVSVVLPRPLLQAEMRLAYAAILLGEQRHGETGGRDYCLHDPRGNALFVRVDGGALARLPRAHLRDLLENLVSTDPQRADAALGALRRGVAASTTLLRQMYPRAVVDWGQSGLIPGLPLREQALERTRLVRGEIEAALSCQHVVDADALLATLRQIAAAHAAPGKASAKMDLWGGTQRCTVAQLPLALQERLARVAPSLVGCRYTLLDRSDQRRYFDAAFCYAAPRVRAQLQAAPPPVLLLLPGARPYFAPGLLAGRCDPSIIVLGHDDMAEACYGLQLHLESLGLLGGAARALRNAQIVHPRLQILLGPTQEYGLQGAFARPDAGKLYGTDLVAAQRDPLPRDAADLRQRLDAGIALDERIGRATACVYLAIAHAILARGHPPEVQHLWARSPDSVAGLLAALRGQFTPGG
jgi:hypothetical protein